MKFRSRRGHAARTTVGSTSHRTSRSHHKGPPGIEPLETRLLFVAGELDLNFSTDGMQTTNFGGTDTAHAAVVQPDGKTVVVGDWDGGHADFAIARYLPNGNLDPTFNDVAAPTLFNGDGKQNVFFGADIGVGVDKATSVALQADGKILVAGYTNFTGTGTNFDFALVRLNADGTIDNTFGGGDGKVTVDFGGDDRANAVAVQPDGKIVLAGQWDGGLSDFAIVRLNPNGSLDGTFSGDGKQNLTFGAGLFGGVERANAVALAPGGDIYVAGYTDAGGGLGPNNFAVARLNSDGSLDAAFDADGKQTVDFGYDDQATAVAIDRRGGVLLAGFDDGGAADFAVARLDSDGTLDTTFNNVAVPNGHNGDGRLSFTFTPNSTFGGVERAFAIALEPNGIDQEIYVAGTTDAGGGGNNFALARIRPNGTLDGSFGGGDGLQITDMGTDEQGLGAAIGSDGKVVVVGRSGADFAVARYLSELDPAFGFDGKQTTNFGYTDAATAVAIQPNGRIVVAGYDDGGSADFAVVRYLPNGNLDTTFNDVAAPTLENGDGRVSFTFGAAPYGGVERATCVAIQPDGKIVVAGYTDAGTTGGTNTFDFAVARLNADGTLDNTFSGDGKATFNFFDDDRAAAVAIQPDGKIVLVGSWDGGHADMVLVRLNTNGTLDTSFNDVALPTQWNGDGKLDIFFGPTIISSSEFATSVALTPGGKIVVGGYTNLGATGGNSNDFAVAVVNPNGTLDTTFSGDGLLTIDFGYDDRASSVALRPLGQIVVGGTSDDGASDFAVAQIRGSALDVSFGGGDGMFRAFTNDADEFSTGMALLENGKIVMVGYSNSATGSPNNFAVTRILADGSRTDPSFNADGEYFIDFGGDDKAMAVAVQPDRRVVVVGSSGGNFAAARLDAAPVVTQVYVNSTAWTPAFRNYLQSHGLGSATYGFAVPAGVQELNELPWINLNEVTFTFSEPLTYAFDDLAVRGTNVPNYALGTLITPNTTTATWRLPAGTFFRKDKVVLDLDGDSNTGIRNAFGATLDGDWNGLADDVYPSGDGAAGGDFRFRINVLPGDTNRSGSVVADDFSAVKKKFFTTTASPVTGTDADYSPFHDVDGSGAILAADFSEVKKRFFDTLPGPEPAALPPLPLLSAASTPFGTRQIRLADELLA